MQIFEFLREIFFYSGYFGSNTKSFPKPLSQEEERKYIELYMKGDEHAREVLIEHNLRLVAHIAKKFASNGSATIEDYISIGTIGLIKGVNTFNLEKGRQLVTYIARCIENAILSHRNKLDLEAKTSHHVAKNGAYSVTYADTGMS